VCTGKLWGQATEGSDHRVWGAAISCEGLQTRIGGGWGDHGGEEQRSWDCGGGERRVGAAGAAGQTSREVILAFVGTLPVRKVCIRLCACRCAYTV
jgi:hypothetical protein